MMLAGMALVLAAAVSPVAAAPVLRPVPTAQDVFPFGVAWYPEQFPERDWEVDLALMAKAHVSVVRVAEFAWSTIEPSEGKYDFAWLDRAIARAAAHGIKVIIGTPTAAPPAWLTTKYPDTLAVERDGRRTQHGWRRQFDVNSGRYRTLAAGIAGQLARRYGKNPAVIGFQIDNEYGRQSFGEIDKRAFQQWMRVRYGTLAELNRRHFNSYWSLDYSDWDQIDIPPEKTQPQMMVDWQRFVSDSFRGYQRAQIDAMRPFIGADKVITTNYVAKYDDYDFSVPAQDLDLVSWDWYFDTPELDPAEGALLQDLYRGFLGRNPWVMETAAGHINWADRNYSEPKGEMRAMAWQAIGHGADGYAYWYWRPALNGTETFHGAFVDPGGRPRPPYAEFAQTGGEIARVWPALKGSMPVADMAMLHDYPSRWAIERQPQTKDYDPFKLFVTFRRAFMGEVKGVDVLRGAGGLDRYALVVAPNLHLMSADTAAKLANYVRGGGHLLLGPRAGVKDEDLTLWRPGALGPLEELLGARIDMGEVPAKTVTLSGKLGAATATVWAERVVPFAADAEALLVYGKSDGWLDGQPAVVTRRVGQGRITYVGTWLDDAALRRIAGWAAKQSKLSPLLPGIPDGVEVVARHGAGGTTYVALNWNDEPETIALPVPMRDLLGTGDVSRVTLDKFGVAVLGAKR